MVRLTRREVLAGIATTSLTAMIGCSKDQAHRENIQAGASPTPQIKYLNVLVHGLAAVEVASTGGDTGIRLWMPSIVDGDPTMSHQYYCGTLVNKLGNYLDEMKPLGPNSVCLLSGVKTGSRPDKSKFQGELVFDGASITPASRMRKFTLPWTDKITPVTYQRRKDKKTLLSDNHSCGTTYETIVELPTICVFKYEVAGAPVVNYDDGTDLGWYAKPSAKDPTYSNLHIFAEPNQSVTSAHAIPAFDTLMAAINKTCLKFNDFSGTQMEAAKPDTSFDGIDKDLDLYHLSHYLKAGETANCLRAVVIQP
jgi:hypothetical protein